MIKSIAKNIVSSILWWQVGKLRKNHKIQIIGVVGSIGKTSTKYAIAQILQSRYKVRWQEGNYNDFTIVPLVFFGHAIPSLTNPISWIKIIIDNQRQIRDYAYEYVVLELGTDGPGQIKEFGKYLKLNLAVVTSVAPEHMEYFKTLDAVAEEELSVCDFSKRVIINKDLVAKQYYSSKSKIMTYGTKGADFNLKTDPKLAISKHNKHWLSARRVLSKEVAYSKAAAAIVADFYNFTEKEITNQLNDVKGAPGRLQILKGIKDSVIIDDTYNSSPSAVLAALSILYGQKAKNKIAILGSMNELGEFAKEGHEQVGNFCDPKQLKLVILVGHEANKYIAPLAKKNGCEVVGFDNPYDAGEYAKKVINAKSAILVKGSQNNVYMEEAVKIFMAKPEDSKKLVRQSNDWLAKKRKNFKR